MDMAPVDPKVALEVELHENKFNDSLRLNQLNLQNKYKYGNFTRYIQIQRQQLEEDERQANTKESAAIREVNIVQEERLAMELNKLKREETKELRLRQILRESSPELKELESKLRAAYINKELTAQVREKEAMKLHMKIRDKQANEMLEKAIIKEEESQRMLKEENIKKKAKYKQELQDQMIYQESSKRFQYEEFLQEKKMLDDIVHRIHDEDEREYQEKLFKVQRTREEIEAFKKAQEIWKKREKEELLEEHLRIQAYLSKRVEMANKVKDEKLKMEVAKAKLADDMARRIFDKEMFRLKIYQSLVFPDFKKFENQGRKELFKHGDLENYNRYESKRRERETLRLELMAEEEKAAIIQNRKDIMEKNLRSKLQMRKSLHLQMKERQEQVKREVEEEVAYKEHIMAKMAEDARIDQLTNEKKRLKRLQLRKEVEQMMKDRRQKRAEEMQELIQIEEAEQREYENRKRAVEEERLRILKEHSMNLVGYFPKGILREDDFVHLGSEFMEKYNAKTANTYMCTK